MFEPIWNANYVDHVQITMAEDIGIGGRAGYYDGIGAARDVIQNHLLQLLALTAMEEPVSFDAQDLRAEKEKVLSAVRLPEDLGKATARGQYAGRLAGRREGRRLPRGGRHRPRPRPPRPTPRSSSRSTPAAGRACRSTCAPASGWAGGSPRSRWSSSARRTCRSTHTATEELGQNAIVIRVQPDEGITMRFGSKVPGAPMEVRDVTMDFGYGESFTESSPEAYERLILDVLLGDPPLFPRHEEVELSWKILDPVEEYWAKQGTPEPYPAGSWGPGVGRRDDAPATDGAGGGRDHRPAQHHDSGGQQEARRSCATTSAAMALGRVLTLVIVADESDADEAIEAANDASREHPCRIIASSTGNKRGASRLDAQIRVGGDAGASEVVVLRLYGALADHGDSVVIPLLLPDAPVVAWWPRERAGATLGRTRSGRWPSGGSPTPREARNPHEALQRRASTLPARRHRPGLDPGHAVAWPARGRARPAAVRAGHRGRPSRGGSDSPSTDLLAGWLALTLRVPGAAGPAPAPAPAWSACGSSAAAATSTWSGPDGVVATLAQPGQPVRRIALLAAAARRVPGRRAAPARPRRDLRRVPHPGAVQGRCPPVDDLLRGHRRGRGTLDRGGPQAVAAGRPQGERPQQRCHGQRADTARPGLRRGGQGRRCRAAGGTPDRDAGGGRRPGDEGHGARREEAHDAHERAQGPASKKVTAEKTATRAPAAKATAEGHGQEGDDHGPREHEGRGQEDRDQGPGGQEGHGQEDGDGGGEEVRVGQRSPPRPAQSGRGSRGPAKSGS